MSFFMIGVVVVAMLIASVANLNLVLGPFKPSEMGSGLATLATLPVAF